MGSGALVDGRAIGCGLATACRGAVGGTLGDEAHPPATSARVTQRAPQAHRRTG